MSVVTNMQPNKKIGVLGFGLAGAAVAAQLLSHNVDFCVFNDHSKASSSRVAAGMFNPMVFRRLLKTWMADEILPYAKEFYTNLEDMLGAKFYFPKQYFKVFGKEEAEFWEKRSKEDDTQPYLSTEILHSLNKEKLKTPYGVGEVKGAGYLDINVYLDRFEIYLKEKGCFQNKSISYDLIELADGKVSIDGEIFDVLIFCEGSHGTQNPWFANLPYKLTKGEVLTIHSDLDIDFALNKNGFMLPIGNNYYRVGATYEWQELNEEPTEKGKATLIEKLQTIINADFEIVEHKAGVRPTLANRRPVYELHSTYKQLAIFNGLGTKGVMLAPFFSKKLVENILGSEE